MSDDDSVFLRMLKDAGIKHKVRAVSQSPLVAEVHTPGVVFTFKKGALQSIKSIPLR